MPQNYMYEHTHTRVYVQHLNQLSTCFLIRDMATCIPRISTKLKQVINMTSETQQCLTLLPTEVQQRFREMCMWLLWNCTPTASVDYTLLPQNMFWDICTFRISLPFSLYLAFSIFHSLSSLLFSPSHLTYSSYSPCVVGQRCWLWVTHSLIVQHLDDPQVSPPAVAEYPCLFAADQKKVNPKWERGREGGGRRERGREGREREKRRREKEREREERRREREKEEREVLNN